MPNTEYDYRHVCPDNPAVPFVVALTYSSISGIGNALTIDIASLIAAARRTGQDYINDVLLGIPRRTPEKLAHSNKPCRFSLFLIKWDCVLNLFPGFVLS